MSILITGGAGYIGSHIVERLIKNKNKTIILDNLSTGHKKLINKKATFVKGDINDKNLIRSILKSYNVKTIIHLAACLNVNEAEINPSKYMKNNEIEISVEFGSKKNEATVWTCDLTQKYIDINGKYRS